MPVPPARLGPLARGAAACLLLAVPLGACGSDTVRVDAPDLSARAAQECRRLVEALPDRVDDQARRTVRPEGVAAAAWGDPAIVLTCTTGTPEGYRPESPCTVVNGIGWFIPEDQLEADGAEDLTMTTLFRSIDVQVRLPQEYFPPAAALADLSTPVAAHTTATEKCL